MSGPLTLISCSQGFYPVFIPDLWWKKERKDEALTHHSLPRHASTVSFLGVLQLWIIAPSLVLAPLFGKRLRLMPCPSFTILILNEPWQKRNIGQNSKHLNSGDSQRKQAWELWRTHTLLAYAYWALQGPSNLPLAFWVYFSCPMMSHLSLLIQETFGYHFNYSFLSGSTGELNLQPFISLAYTLPLSYNYRL